MPLGRIRARPSCTVRAAHAHSVGSTRVHSARDPWPQRWLGPVHSARGPRLARPASACSACDGVVRRASACRSGHCSLGMCRGAAGGGATSVEVEQMAALEHPQRRGYPSGMGVEAIAHRSSMLMGRGRKTGSAAAFSDEVRAPVAGGGPATVRRRES
jgi:hypothetical protein